MKNKNNFQYELNNQNDNLSILEQKYSNEIENNIDYSLEIDPTHKYHFNEKQKKFIKFYLDFKSVASAAELADIDMNTAKEFFVSRSVQEEINRLSLAMYHRQFKTKMIGLDSIGGYLTSLLIDNNVPIVDRLKTTEKLQVIKMLIDLNKFKIESFINPEVLMTKDIESELKNLSIESIKTLLNHKSKQNKNDFITTDYEEVLTDEEQQYLKSLDNSELLDILESINNSDNKQSQNHNEN